MAAKATDELRVQSVPPAFLRTTEGLISWFFISCGRIVKQESLPVARQGFIFVDYRQLESLVARYYAGLVARGLCTQQHHFLATSGFKKTMSRMIRDGSLKKLLGNENGRCDARNIDFTEPKHFQRTPAKVSVVSFFVESCM